jgi:hypothetical protein
MATISINPDVDGDLHSAALHNDKFQTILNEINGNLDAANLLYPKSVIQFPFSARSGTLAGGGTNLIQVPWGFPETPTDKQDELVTSGFPHYNYATVVGANGCHIYLNSITANVTGQTMSLMAGGGILTWQATSNFTNNNIIVYFQKSATINGNAWEDMANATISPHIVANAENRSSTFTITDGNLLTGWFFRVLVQNNAGAALIIGGGALTGPPLSSGAAYFTVPHVA